MLGVLADETYSLESFASGTVQIFVATLCILALFNPKPAFTAPVNIAELAKTALVIGNGNYSIVGALKNPLNDAEDICKTLHDLGYTTLCYTDIKTRVQFKAILQDYAETISPNSVSVIYYAGHAVQIGGVNYLIPTGVQLQIDSSVIDESVDLSYLMSQLRQTRSFLKIIILDACRNNPLLTSTQSSGLAQITDTPDGTVVLYATAAEETALDGEGRNGILTKSLLKHIREPGSIDDLFRQISAGVGKDSEALGHYQQPALYKNFNGQYCFVKCTDLEELQSQQETNKQQIAALQARVEAGDTTAKAQLSQAEKKATLLNSQIQKKERQARDRQQKAFVPLAF